MPLGYIPSEATSSNSNVVGNNNAVTVQNIESVINSDDTISLTLTMSDESRKVTTIQSNTQILQDINSNLIPAVDDSVTLGSSDKKLKNGYFKTLTVDNFSYTDGNIFDTITTDEIVCTNIPLEFKFDTILCAQMLNKDFIFYGDVTVVDTVNTDKILVNQITCDPGDSTDFAFTFKNNTDTGFYYSGNVLNFKVDGAANPSLIIGDTYCNINSITSDSGLNLSGDLTTTGSVNINSSCTVGNNIIVSQIDSASDILIRRNGDEKIKVQSGVTRIFNNLHCDTFNSNNNDDVTFYRYDNIHLTFDATNKILLHRDTLPSGSIDLGASDNKFVDLHLSGNVYSEVLDSGSNNPLILKRNGDEKIKVKSGEVELTDHINFKNAGTYIKCEGLNKLYFNTSGTTYVDNHFSPGSDNLFDCGGPGRRWDDVWATNGTIQTSDLNKKQNIDNLDLGLDFINELTPKKYQYIDGNSGRYHFGLIAQEVKSVMDDFNLLTSDFAGYIHSPSGVNERDGEEYPETFGLRYTEFIAPMIKAIQELNQENMDLKDQIDDISQRLDALEN
jgi:hypothetical protein